MHIFDENIKKLGLIIPEPPDAVANYVPFKIIDNIMYISGQAPLMNGKLVYTGKVGDTLSVEKGIKAAELCCINIIANLKKGINNNIPIIRNIVYKRINDMLKDIKEITPEMSDFFKDKVDINMKNAINKILNDYKTQ